jgi:hypothetical protein
MSEVITFVKNEPVLVELKRHTKIFRNTVPIDKPSVWREAVFHSYTALNRAFVICETKVGPQKMSFPLSKIRKV